MVCIFLAALDQTVVIPALPAIASDLDAYRQLSWIVAAYLITSTISTPIYRQALRHLWAPAIADRLHCHFHDLDALRQGAISQSAHLVARTARLRRRRIDGADPVSHRG
jgi:MFS family permease